MFETIYSPIVLQTLIFSLVTNFIANSFKTIITFISTHILIHIITSADINKNDVKCKICNYLNIRQRKELDSGIIFHVGSRFLWKDFVYISIKETGSTDLTIVIYSSRYYVNKFIEKINKLEIIEKKEQATIFSIALWYNINEYCSSFDFRYKDVSNIYTIEQEYIIDKIYTFYTSLNKANLSFLNKNIKIILCGPSGVGKTELGFILALKFNADACMTTLSTLIEKPGYINGLKKARGLRSDKVNVLIVNEVDIAFDKFSKEEITITLDNLNNIEKIICIFSTNKSKTELQEQYEIYTRIGRIDRIYDIITMDVNSLMHFLSQIFKELNYVTFDKLIFPSNTNISVTISEIIATIKYEISKGEEHVVDILNKLINDKTIPIVSTE